MKLTSSVLVAFTLAAPAFSQGADECTGATTLVSGVAEPFVTSGQTASAEAWLCVDQAPDLWYQYTTVGGSGTLRVETCGSTYDTALEVFSGTCGSLTLQDCNDDGCGRQSAIIIPLPPGAGVTYYIRVGGYAGAVGSGQILLIEGDDPDCAMADALEGSVDCATATPLGDGTYVGLNVEEADNDYYAVTIPAGATLSVDLRFVASISDVDLFLWDPAVACDSNDPTSTGLALAQSTSTTGTESVAYTNASGAPLDVIVEIDMYTGGGCNDYDMDISGVGTVVTSIGTSYCTANANSTGAASEIGATGSTSVAANDVTLTATGLPTFAFGFFIVSDTTGFAANPAGSSGNLCVGGAIGRYVGPGQIMSSLGTGSITLGVNLAAIPRPTGAVATAPGDTWSFQLWHRDSSPAGPTSNFTNGTTIVFN
ncbi:hypothetical protein Poly30_08320 [Planctomycetes bacterium Poly30]|uniref:Peptidase C-terminal archaeal/bacterial domain-containing protein n=1 Tax=Saltatorellus ferox TaxID=2528018 RepID=A0A518EMM8_9BACT|nr:hypothetical protein Poly30_08320 [Planctomycetes bacterium Poly30]